METALTSRREFYFRRQQGLCCLRRTFACNDVGGFMDIRASRSKRYATWDHILTQADGGKDAGNILLACAECNADRGRGPAPFPLFAQAENLWAAWQAHLAEFAPKPKQKAKRQAPTQKMIDTIEATIGLEDDVGRREQRGRASGVICGRSPTSARWQIR